MTSQRRTRRLLAGLVSGAGVLAFTVNLFHLFEETDVVASLTGVFLPMGLALALVGAGFWLDRSPIETTYLPRVVGWFGVGTVVMTAIGVALLVYQVAEGGRVRHAGYVLLNLVTTGGIGGVVVGTYDARQRQRRQQLADSRERYRTLTDAAPDAMFVADVETGEIIDVNAEAERLVGRPRDELVGMEQAALHPAENAEQYRDLFAAHVSAEKAVMTELPDGSDIHVVRSDGERVPVEINAAVFEQRDRTLVLGIFRDVSRRKARERELERTTEELEILNRVVRHDIRNDMEVVSSWLVLLDDHVDQEGQDIIDRMTTATKHTIELTDVARDYVQMVSGQTEQDLTGVSLAPLLEKELETRRASYPDAEFTVDGSLPAVDVLGNEMLSSVFRNLLNNAVQHNDKDTPRVRVSTETTSETVTVRVADNGPGVPDDRTDDIFGKGEKGLESPGTGIGLYLVQQLVAGYGGSVRVEDRADGSEGAVFVVELQRPDQ